MNSFNVLLLLLTTLSCGVNVKTGLDGTQTNNSTPEALTAGKWCSMKKLSNGQLDVSRLRLSNDYINLSKILVNADQSLSVYQLGEKNKFKMKGAKVWIYSAEVTRITGARNAAALKNFFKQAALAISLGNTSFNPKQAVNVRYVNWFGDDEEIQYYPCGAFAKTLNTNQKPSPVIEYKVKMSEVQGTFRNSNLDSYHALTAPMAYKKVLPSAINGTQWCGWNITGQTVNSLIVLTISAKTFKENMYENQFYRMSNAEIETWFEARKRDQLRFRKTSKNATVYGTRSEKLQRQKVVYKKNYSFFEDSKGLRAFVVAEPRTYMIKNDLFFPCTDLRPVQGDATFSNYFDRILAQEKN